MSVHVPEVIPTMEHEQSEESGETGHAAIEMAETKSYQEAQLTIDTESEISNTGTNNKKNKRSGRRGGRSKPEKFEDVLNESRSKCYKLLRDSDDAMVKGRKEEIDTLLVFAGLFSAVVTAFNIQTFPVLQSSPDPSIAILTQISAQLSNLQTNGQTATTGTSTQPSTQAQATPSSSGVSTSLIVVNALWFTSLILSLVAASIGILLKQWLREYTSGMTNSVEQILQIRQFRYDALVRWRVKEIVMLLPFLLQIALIVFLVGLVQLVWTLNSSVAVVVTTLVSASLTFILVTTLLPTVSVMCPYKSPQALFFFHSWRWIKAFSGAIIAVFADIWVWMKKLPRTVTDLCTTAPESVRSLANQTRDERSGTRPSLRQRMNDLIGVIRDFALSIYFIVRRPFNSFRGRLWLPRSGWNTREQLHIPPLRFVLGVRVLEELELAYSRDIYEASPVAGPIAVDLVACMNDKFYPESSTWQRWKCLDFVEKYYLRDLESAMDPQLFFNLTRLLKDNATALKAWTIIKWFVHRKSDKPGPPYPYDWSTGPLLMDDGPGQMRIGAMADYAKRQEEYEKFIEACFLCVRFATLVSDQFFEIGRDELKELLQVLRTRKPPPLDWLPSVGILVNLERYTSYLLSLSQRDADVVQMEVVDAIEDLLRNIVIVPEAEVLGWTPATVAEFKSNTMQVLQNVRESLNQERPLGGIRQTTLPDSLLVRSSGWSFD